MVVVISIPAGAGGHRAVHGSVPHRAAQGVAGHADPWRWGLLVDDAIIAVETMAVKLEQGYDRLHAAAFAYTSTAFPMLTGTWSRCRASADRAREVGTGEYTRSIFEVSAIALLLSWLAAVIVIPLLGYRILSEHPTRRAFGISPRRHRAATSADDVQHADVYDTRSIGACAAGSAGASIAAAWCWS
jgi:multidrug efflux pump